MGGDGGSIPGRADLVRTKKKAEQKDKASELSARWKACAISQEALKAPIVACELGRIYNKEVILEFLLDRGKFSCAPSFAHIKGLKDVHELKLTDGPKSSNGDDSSPPQSYICPITSLEMNGMHRFGYLLDCGCVFSERAIKEVKGDTCTNCSKHVDYNKFILLNPGDEETIALMTKNMEERKLAAKKDKKKRKRVEAEIFAATGVRNGEVPDTKHSATSSKRPALDSETSSKHSSQTGPAGDRPKANSQTINASFGKVVSKKSVQADPKATNVFKSIFSTSKEAKEAQKTIDAKRPAWVTYNPLYY